MIDEVIDAGVTTIDVASQNKGWFKKKEDKEEEEEKKDKSISNIILSFCAFGTTIFIMGLFYLGALSNYGGMGVQEYNQSISPAIDMVKDAGVKVLVRFYEVGSENPKAFILVFWSSIVYWFYSLSSDIYKYIKNKRKREIK